MNVLDIKVMRDLWAMRTQVLSIALLIAAGIALLVMSVSNYLALVGAMDAHYRNERFADLFASLKRAPISLVERIREIDGGGVVEPRVAQAVRVIREDLQLPISGRIISIPLREKIGDAQFIKALQEFYRDNRFRMASYDDIRKSFEAVSGLDLRPFFDQWIKEVGTPELRLDQAAGHGERVDITLSQVQPGRLYTLDVPVIIETDKGVETRTVSMPSDRARIDVSFDLKGRAQRVEIDPQFQVYRRLSPFEIPPSLSKAFGAKRVLIVMSAQSAPDHAGLAKAWSRDGVETVMDSQLDVLPADRAVWVLGAGNKFMPVVADALKTYGGSLDASGLRTANAMREGAGRSLVAVARHPRNPDSVVVYVAASSEAAANALARKLPHYGKYSWLVFAGDEATNEATGEWPIGDTPLARNLTPQGRPIKVTPRKALAEVRAAWPSPREKSRTGEP